MNKVYTYYDPVRQLMPGPVDLLGLWKKSWQAQGWTPVILNETKANQHNEFHQYRAAIRKLPTTNPRAYEEACFLRHLAMAQIGGGLLTDYDVINYGYRPGMLPETLNGVPAVLSEGKVPCVVCASVEGYLWLCGQFAKYQRKKTDMAGDRAHISDMTIVQQLPVMQQAVCREYAPDRDEWKTALLVHYSTHSMYAGNRKRRDKVATIMQAREVVW